MTLVGIAAIIAIVILVRLGEKDMRENGDR